MILLVLKEKTMKFTSFYFVIFLLFPTFSIYSQKNSFDWQGHRGARGLFPENSILAFINALKYPVTTLELDVVISKDHHVVVSHEPWFSDEICEECPYENNLYRLNLDQIQSIDCVVPPLALCTDNAAMIGLAAEEYLTNYSNSSEFVQCNTRLGVKFPKELV